jgi:hypothetical protein
LWTECDVFLKLYKCNMILKCNMAVHVHVWDHKIRVYKIEINGRGDPLRCSRDTLYPQQLASTSPKCEGRLVGIVRLRTKVTEFFFILRSDFFMVSQRSLLQALWKLIRNFLDSECLYWCYCVFIELLHSTIRIIICYIPNSL